MRSKTHQHTILSNGPVVDTMVSDWDSDLDSERSTETNPFRRVFHADGTQSNVYRQQLQAHPDGQTRWVAVKVVSFIANSSTKPHDVVKEAKLLVEELRHPNVSIHPAPLHRNRSMLVLLTLLLKSGHLSL